MTSVSRQADGNAATVLSRLDEDHFHLTRVMQVLEDELAKRDDDDADIDWNLLADVLAYVGEYPDAVHHPLEDRMFDRVLDKGLTPAERELVHFNLSQHAEIVGATTQLADDVNNILSDVVVPIDVLMDHCRRYLDMQRSHMRNEQVHLFPLAERRLGEEDWAEIATELAAHADPMFVLRQGRFDSLYERVAATG